MLRASDRSGIAVTFAMLLACFILLPLTQDVSYVPLAMVLVLVLGAVALVARRLGLNNGVVLAVQLAVLIVFLGAIAFSLGGSEGNYLQRAYELYASAGAHLRDQAAPMPPHPGVKLLFVSAIGVVSILTDIMVVGIERPAWAIAPPLTLYLVPALGLTSDIAWYPFACIALGYLAILLSEGIGSAERWPRHIDSSSNRQGHVGPFAARTAALIGVPTLAVALLLGSVVPLPGQPGWGLERARGNNGPLQLADPTLDLKRNLTQPDDATVLTYRTDRPTGSYLRMASLPVINSDGWQNTSVSLVDDRTLGPVPGAEVRSDIVRKTEISVGDFSSQYLPMPYAPRQFSAEGQFAYDPQSLVVIGTGDDLARATRNLSYSVDSLDVDPSGAQLSKEEAGTPADANLTASVPADIPAEIISLTLDITKDAPTPALKAAAIQKFLRSSAFTYSTEPQPGSGFDALSNFLLRDRRGYCEQFAASMALMARIVGIPSRVEVGFLPGERNGDLWEVTIRDMHAWPSLYFADSGWVRFEPTPATVTGQAPTWTVEASSSGQPSEAPSASESARPEGQASESDSPTPTPTASASAEPEASALPWGRLAGGFAALLGLVALGLIPGLLRRRARSARLASADKDLVEQVEDAWAEIRATVVDFGDRWPAGSPRAMGAELAERLPEDAAGAASTLSELIERARFAREYTGGEVARLTETVIAGLEADRSWDQRLIAHWWPRSLWADLARRLPWN